MHWFWMLQAGVVILVLLFFWLGYMAGRSAASWHAYNQGWNNAMQRKFVERAFQSGNIVVGGVNENGDIEVMEIPLNEEAEE
jgi:hypothetical protein